MKIRRGFGCILLLFIIHTCLAQTYRYLGVEEGLSNRRVYAVEKDKKGYMWFLTHEGVDKFNGEEIKRYRLPDNENKPNSQSDLAWLCIDRDSTIWEIGKQGNIFRYDSRTDAFQQMYPQTAVSDKEKRTVSYSFIDQSNRIWLCSLQNIYLYHIGSKEIKVLPNLIKEEITCVVQQEGNHFFVGTNRGIHCAELTEQGLTLVPCPTLDSQELQAGQLFYHSSTRQLFIGSFLSGIYVYNANLQKFTHLSRTNGLPISVNCITPLNGQELLIGTNGGGIFRINVYANSITPYLSANYEEVNGMNGNTINDICVDDKLRLWIANYPIGVTIQTPYLPHLKWRQHSIGNSNTLVNNQVNGIFEDSDGDLWFATSNGVSLYKKKENRWHSFLSSYNQDLEVQNHIFTTLCEVEKNEIWVGGYSTYLYRINKNNLEVSLVDPLSFGISKDIRDKYVRNLFKDSEGKVWRNGFYHLACIDPVNKRARFYQGPLTTINCVIEKDKDHLWLGTSAGLFTLNKRNGEIASVRLSVEKAYIYTLFQAANGTLYIGTGGAGMLLYTRSGRCVQYRPDNCSLLSSSIYTIFADKWGNIVLSSGSGLSRFYPGSKKFYNISKDQGLVTDHFNASSGTWCKYDNTLIFGSSEGAVEMSGKASIPSKFRSRMVLTDFRLFYQTSVPGEKDSPLTTEIDSTQVLRLKYTQNIFSLKVSSINYDYPHSILYSWKLEGLYDQWSEPGKEDIIRFTNLSEGKYKLHIRSLSAEDHHIIEERTLEVIVAPPFWRTLWAYLAYLITAITIIGFGLRLMILRQEKIRATEKIDVMVRTAHDVHAPVELIKEALSKGNWGEAQEQANKLSHQVRGFIINPSFALYDDSESTLFLAKVKLEIEKNMHDVNFSIDMLCAKMNMSRTSFYTRIKGLTNQTPADFIRSERIRHAAHLLATKKHSITEVASMTGFSDVRYFREVFKKQYSVNPSKYIDPNQE